MRRNKYIRLAKATFLLIAGVVLSGCTNDGGDIVKKPVSDGSVNLSISLPTPVAKNMTRAVPAEFNQIDDLNIIIASGSAATDNVNYIFFLDDMSAAGVAASIPKPEWVEYTETGNSKGIHFTKEWFEYFALDAENCVFYIVANNGSKIPLVATVADLHEFKIRDNQYIMFGESVEVTNTAHTGQPGHETGRSLQVMLKRLTAMITVKIVGAQGLNSNLIIAPQTISLHNVPASCTLGDYNNVTGNAPNYSPLVDPDSRSGTSIFTQGQSANVTSWGDITRDVVVGGHYIANDSETPDGSTVDWTKIGVQPLFMYENYHGETFGVIPNTDQRYKRPVGAAMTETDIEEKSQACSYIQITADFREGTQEPYTYGQLTYRVFLGADEFENFDVMRNTYYRLTLTLSGNARANEGNASWRLDYDERTMQLSDSDIIVNGGGEVIAIDVEDGNTPSAVKVTWPSGYPQTDYRVNPSSTGTTGSPWIYVYNVNQWEVLEDIQNDNFPLTANDQFLLYIIPMIRDVTWFGAGHIREVTFQLASANGNTNSGPITVTQYEPIQITVGPNSPEEVWQYAQTVLGWTTERTFFIDRVNYSERPWGFDVNQISANGNSGLANGYNLTQAPYTATANSYRPLGKPGSAMMHAEFMKYYQRNTAGATNVTGISLNPTIEQIQTYSPPAGYPSEFFIPSIEEWGLLDLLDKAGVDVYDPAYPMTPWDAYWTSDAVTADDSRDSNGYRMGATNPVSVIPRTTATRYRLMYFKP